MGLRATPRHSAPPTTKNALESAPLRATPRHPPVLPGQCLRKSQTLGEEGPPVATTTAQPPNLEFRRKYHENRGARPHFHQKPENKGGEMTVVVVALASHDNRTPPPSDT